MVRTHRQLRPTPVHSAAGKDGMIGVAFLVWMFSGNPMITATPYYVPFQVIGFLIEFFVCFPRLIYLDRLRPFLTISGLYTAWFVLSIVAGLSDQVIGLLGQLLKIGMVALLVSAAQRPIESLIEAMVLICKIALPIFVIRQVLLFIGVDLADIFKFMYSLTGETVERSIFIFNFHTVEDSMRNSGPFREPGLFAANLVIANILLLSPRVDYGARARMGRAVLFGAALLTTGSTMAILAMAPLGALILRQIPSSNLRKLLFVSCAGIGVAAIFAASYSDHLEKIRRQIELTQTESNTWYQSRFGNAYVDYVAVMERPIVGYGFAETGRPILWNTRIQAQYVGEGNIGFGNGFSGTFVKFGIPFAALIYLFITRNLLALSGNKFAGYMSVFAFFIILFSQQLLLLPAIYSLCSVLSHERSKPVPRKNVLHGHRSRPVVLLPN